MKTPWVNYFTQVVTVVNNQPVRLNKIELITQSASIAATDLQLGSLTEGYYDVAFYARITQAATTSSSLQITVAWTESAVSLTKSSIPLVSNTTVTTDVQFRCLIRADGATPVTFATTYASVGATPMVYRITAILSRLAA